jgi:hypothetical protein
VAVIDADEKWFRCVLVDLMFLAAGAGCFIFSFSRFLGYACLIPLLLGCFLMCFSVFDFLVSLGKLDSKVNDVLHA